MGSMTQPILRGPVRPPEPVRDFPDPGLEFVVRLNVHGRSSLSRPPSTRRRGVRCSLALLIGGSAPGEMPGTPRGARQRPVAATLRGWKLDAVLIPGMPRRDFGRFRGPGPALPSTRRTVGRRPRRQDLSPGSTPRMAMLVFMSALPLSPSNGALPNYAIGKRGAKDCGAGLLRPADAAVFVCGAAPSENRPWPDAPAQGCARVCHQPIVISQLIRLIRARIPIMFPPWRQPGRPQRLPGCRTHEPTTAAAGRASHWQTAYIMSAARDGDPSSIPNCGDKGSSSQRWARSQWRSLPVRSR